MMTLLCARGCPAPKERGHTRFSHNVCQHTTKLIDVRGHEWTDEWTRPSSKRVNSPVSSLYETRGVSLEVMPNCFRKSVCTFFPVSTSLCLASWCTNTAMIVRGRCCETQDSNERVSNALPARRGFGHPRQTASHEKASTMTSLYPPSGSSTFCCSIISRRWSGGQEQPQFR